MTSVVGGPPKEISCDPAGPLVAEVVKTTSDPYVGRISLVRVFSGTLRPDTTVHVSGHGAADGARGPRRRRAGRRADVPAGQDAADRVILRRGRHLRGGEAEPRRDRRHPVRPRRADGDGALVDVRPAAPGRDPGEAKADDDKLSQALARLVAEDPTLRLENNAETRQLVLWCMGEAHADVLIDRLRTRYGVEVDRVDLRVRAARDVRRDGQGLGRHVKQSGGHGQYGICHIDVEPLPSGEGFEFVDKIVGGVVPRQFIPSVEKGVRQQMGRGVTAGYPLVDIKVTLHDGKAHSVDSSDMAFQAAGALALKDAAGQVPILLLEPVDEVAVLIADDYVGAIMSDLTSRRGRVLGSQAVPGGRTMIKAEVPQLEIVRYAIDLRSMSQGTGTFSRTFLRYEPLPSHLADKVAAEPGTAASGRASRAPPGGPGRGSRLAARGSSCPPAGASRAALAVTGGRRGRRRPVLHQRVREQRRLPARADDAVRVLGEGRRRHDQLVLAGGRHRGRAAVALSFDAVGTGMKRAEIEGQMPRIRRDPSLHGDRRRAAQAASGRAPADPDLRRAGDQEVEARQGRVDHAAEPRRLGREVTAAATPEAPRPVRPAGDPPEPARTAWGRWWFGPVPRARVAWLRIIGYVFLPFDMLLLTSSSLAHARLPADLYQPVLLGCCCTCPRPRRGPCTRC